jgi:hypothetical protein
VVCRRDYRSLAAAERARFVQALYDVKSRGVVDQFAQEHDAHFDHGHSNSGFLPWHREFLRRFEAELKAYDERVMLCYWNSSADQSTTSQLWSQDFLGQFDGAWGLGRSLGNGGWLPPVDDVNDAFDLGIYAEFRPYLEHQIHDGPHPWVGGVMSGGTSPLDPVFYLHHCWIDMLWAQWQLRHPGVPFEAEGGGVGLNDHLHPWSTTPADVLDHRLFNVYSYPGGYIPDAPRITPPPSAPPTITWVAVPEGLTFFRPAVFEIDACEHLHFDIGDPVVDIGPAGSFERIDPSIVVDPHVEPVGRVWIACRGASAGDHLAGRVEVRCLETDETWQVPLTADVIPKPRAAIAMVLDQSNSMNEESGIGPGIERSDVLRFSAPPALDVLDDDHAALVISFDHDPHLLRGVTPTHAAGRAQLNAAIAGYAPNPDGWTAIGEAVKFAHDQLESLTGYDVKAIVVLTDGQERHGPHDRLSLPEVEHLVSEHVFAIGLGTGQAIDPANLEALCRQHKGYMVLTGGLTPDSWFRLAKYYQDISAGVTNQEIVLDPDGVVHAGQIVQIPFHLAETEISARAVLITDSPRAVTFALQTPDGEFILPQAPPAMTEFRVGNAFQMWQVSLPLPMEEHDDAHAGLWHAWIGIGGGAMTMVRAHLDTAQTRSARYSLHVHAYSNLRMRTSLDQSGTAPGATMYLRTTLEEYGLPLQSPAFVHAQIEAPDGSSSTSQLAPTGPGAHELSVQATQMGVYHFHLTATGTTRRGRAFTREAHRTGATWRGGGGSVREDPGAKLCRLLHCLLADDGVQDLLRRHGMDPDQVGKCLHVVCRPPARRADLEAEVKELLGGSGTGVVEMFRKFLEDRH